MSQILKTYLENQAAIRRLLRRFFRGCQDVEDLTQETFVRALSAERTQDVRFPRAFLFRVAKNVALDEKKRFWRTTTDYLEDSDIPDVSISDRPGIEDEVNAAQVMTLLAAAIEALPLQCRKVFVLYRLEGLSHKEIATTLGISTNTVEKQVATGLLKCTEFLRRHHCEVDGAKLRLMSSCPAGKVVEVGARKR